MTPKSLWSMLKTELSSYWDWELAVDGVDAAVEKYMGQKVSLLRAFCQRTGIQVINNCVWLPFQLLIIIFSQILMREYSYEVKNRNTFFEEDIINVFPVVKHINPRASDAFHFYTTGQQKIQQGFLKEGYELISEALNLLNNVYGAMHPEIAQCLRMLARLNYIMGEHVEALGYQQKAVFMSERVNGIDHPYTITEYVSVNLKDQIKHCIK